MGELRDDPRSLNIEKLEVIALAPLVKKLSNPICSVCGKSMQSLGREAGYRCRRCGAKAKPSEAVRVQIARELQVGWYEPPVSARRHLSKPIKRMAPC
jgi:tRNA(Ile2)-agmatinylcytidine synthase